MKKHFLKLSFIALTAGMFVFSGCKKDDVTAPVVTLNGGDKTISLQGAYVELGATATDDKDGVLTPIVTGTVNKDKTGTYTITYSATDAAGNEGTATRTVTVKNDADIYAGAYTCVDLDFGTLSPWQQTVTASQTLNNAIVFSQFAARTGNTTVQAILTGGTAFAVIPTLVPSLGANGCSFKYTPNGVGISVVKTGGKYVFSVKYFEERVAGGTACTATTPAPYEDTLTQN